MLVIAGRDGVLTAGGPTGADPRAATLLPGAAAALRRLNDAGHGVVVLLERRGSGGGMAAEAWREVEGRLRDALQREGARVDRVLPPNADDETAGERIDEVLRAHRVTSGEAVVITNSLPMLTAASAAGCRRLLVRTGAGAGVQAAGLPAHVLPAGVHADLAAAVDALLGPVV